MLQAGAIAFREVNGGGGFVIKEGFCFIKETKIWARHDLQKKSDRIEYTLDSRRLNRVNCWDFKIEHYSTNQPGKKCGCTYAKVGILFGYKSYSLFFT